MGMTKPPDEITPADLDVIVMPNGEILCLGQTVGWVSKLGRFLTPKNLTTTPTRASKGRRT